MRQIIRENKNNDLSQMLEINRIQLERIVNSEIAIVLKMADSPLIKRYFANPGESELEKTAFEEIASYRRALSENMIFWVNDIDRIFYSDDDEPFWLDIEDPVNYWYKLTLYETELYNFNINYNPELQTTKVWLNAPVFDNNHKPIGILGTGIELSKFINTIFQDIPSKVQLYFFNAYGEISGAKDIILVEEKRNIEHEMIGISTGILEKAKNLEPGEIQTFDVPSGIMAIGSLPILEWNTVAFMPDSIDDYKTTMSVLFLVVLGIIFLIFTVFNLFILRFLKSLARTMEYLDHARSEAEEANKSKSNFLATMSHEIRTPLNAIIGIAQIQLQKTNLPDDYVSSLEKIHKSGNTLLGIINDILDLSKIETGKLELNPAEYSIPNFINDAAQLNLIRIGSKPIELTLDIDKGLPSRLYGDELRLKQILNNLLSNAIKYTEKGTVKLSVNHSVEGTDVTLRFVVEDTGQGMKSEDRIRLFSYFLPFNSKANRSTEGTGLGLSITKKLVEMMDGTIAAESEFGKGSIFTVTMKQKKVECDAIGADIAKRLNDFTFKNDTETSSQQIVHELMPDVSVLIVDDVEINLFVAEGILSLYTPKIEMASSGFEVIEKIENGKTYDIIFMEYMMPKMDGIETTRKLRAMGYKGVIVALTATALVGSDEMFIQNGFNSFLSKPIDMAALDKTLKNFIPENKRQIRPI
jgi:signal transduction histidine kinase/CheY-like chemotaxis protein